ncbi:mycocerosic acid synthase [Periconia macrospinosa]|uniref:Mycocerosic acid synthase n=1 Tax=Periconia macrospinosa TaxID=97972 RepID=A0A2V1D7W1_9PLEO|nr:mycocerosic acid synthase [Periconia macrospinosa]
MNANIKAFDAPFFSMTPAEAASLDPQQRMLLECVYTAMENAGYTMAEMNGTSTGVYAGAFMWDYRQVLMKDVDVPMTYHGTGTLACTLAGRISWFYNFRGPAFTLDTACSSSMVALHQAVVGLRTGGCNMALACGTNIIFSPEMAVELNGLGVLGPDSTSYSFDKRANGYGRGEGIGTVVLKRMSDAIRDGDTIRAVIRNTGCNHDGHSASLSAPSKEAQSELMAHTYAQVKLDPSETRFFEAHGTGTPVGDPIEAGAISGMFSKYRSAEEPLIIGALKSNVGHSEGNSGISSFIKSVLCVESGIIPANAWHEEKNPAIPDEWHLQFATKAMSWPKSKTGVRRVSINSFGVSGTNVHVVLDDARHFLKEHGYDDAPHRTVEDARLPGVTSNIPPAINGTNFTPQLFVLSSHDQDGISRLCKAYKGYLPSMTESLYNLSYTLASKRSRFTWRSATVASSGQELEHRMAEGLSASRAAVNPSVGLVFTGQGAQWARMGRELLLHYRSYRQSLEAADAYLKELGCEWSALGKSNRNGDSTTSRINDAEFSQTLCTAVQVALVDLLADWGLKYRAAAGHSSGEIAAAYSAGAISQKCAWRIAYWRGKLCAKLADDPEQPKGTMAAVGLDLEKTQEMIDRVHKYGFKSATKLTVACMNSKTSHTVSGDVAQIDALVETLNQERIFARKLKVKMAYHSTHMEPIAKEYTFCIGRIQPGQQQGSEVRFFSSAYGTEISHSKLQDAGYWTKNLVSAVRFNESMTGMLQALTNAKGEEGSQSHLVTDIIEIGPHSALQGPLRNITDEARGNGGVKYHHVLQREEPDLATVMRGVGSLFTRGIELDLVKVNRVSNEASPSMLIDLPRYPFNHSREYWNEGRLSRNFRFRPHARHELLGMPVNDWDGKHDAVWRNWIRLSENPWVEHHTISGSALYPAAGMLVMAIEGCKQLAENSNPGKSIKGFRFREVSFHSALQVPDNATGVESHLYLRPVKQAALESKASAWREFQVCTAQDDDEWREHCCGQVLVEFEEGTTAVDGGREDQVRLEHCRARIEDAQQKCKSAVAADTVYDAWRSVGLDFGPSFQTVTNSLVDHETGVTLATVKPTTPFIKTLMPKPYLQPHLIHPTTLDGALQVCLVPVISNPARKQKSAVVVSFIEEIWHLMGCTAVAPSTGSPMVSVSGIVVSNVDFTEDDALNEDEDPRHQAWNIDWKLDPEFLAGGQAEKAFQGPGGFQRFLDVLAHKNPSMKFIDVSNGSQDFSKRVLATLGQRFAQYHLTSDSSSSLEAFQKGNSLEFVEFKLLDLKSGLSSSQGFDEGSYDVLSAPLDLISNADIDGVLATVKKLLKPKGKIILTTTTTLDKDMAQTCSTSLRKNGFAGIEAQLADEDSTVLISSASSHESNGNGTNGITASGSYYIVGDLSLETQSRVAEKLTSSLQEEKGVTARAATISQYAQLAASTNQEEMASSTCILLAEWAAPLLKSANDEVLATLKTMVNGKRLLWVNSDASPETALVNGFAASIRLERPGLEFIILTMKATEAEDLVAKNILEVDRRLSSHEGLTETSYRFSDGMVTIPRLIPAPEVTKHISKKTPTESISQTAFGADSNRALRLRIKTVGLLNSLYFTDDDRVQAAAPLGEDEVEFRTMATGVNFKDLAVMLGKIQETPVGLEAAGVVTRVGSGVTRFKPGDGIFGFTFEGAFSTYGKGWEGTLAKIPEGVSFAEAAAIPIVYTTAYACLYDIGGLKSRATRRRGNQKPPSVLIHAAAGGVGQAAIQMAQREGAEIFATVGSTEKRDFIEKNYGIPRDHIFSSRDLTFKTGIQRMTQGRGVDIVINSLAGDTLRASWEIVAPFGAFAEIGLSDIESRARISMAPYARGVRFESLELNYMRNNGQGRLDDIFSRAMTSVLGGEQESECGLKAFTPIKNYPVSQIEDALRFMQSGKHIGKLVIEYNASDMVAVLQPSTIAAPTTFAADATYVVSGGLGGLGLEIVKWMVDQGARNLCLVSRSGLVVGTAAESVVTELRSQGVKVVTPACDITNKEALEEMVSSTLADMPPVRGCIQASAVFADNIFEQMTIDGWHSAVAVKSTGSMNLWESLTSHSSNSTLDFFAMLSSLFGVTGNSGQANYAAGNAYQDAMARHLSSQGHNVIALNAPVLSDAGVVATIPKLKEYLTSTGLPFMSVGELINTLDYYCRPADQRITNVGAVEAQLFPRLSRPEYSANEGAEQPGWQHEPMYNHMVLRGGLSGSKNAGESGAGGKRLTSSLIAAAESLEAAQKIVLEALLEQLAKTLGYELEDLDPAKPMNAHGVDSLVAVEMRVWMTKEIGADISVFELTSGEKMEQLAARAAAGSRFLPNFKSEEVETE